MIRVMKDWMFRGGIDTWKLVEEAMIMRSSLIDFLDLLDVGIS